MRLRLQKRKTLFEVYERVRVLEEQYSGLIEDIPDNFAEGRMGQKEFEDYAEWLGMFHALRAYGEGEDFDYYAEEIIELDWEKTRQLSPRRMQLLNFLSESELDWEKTRQLSPRRMQLLNFLSESNVDSINKLSKAIGRDVKNIYNDLKILERLGFLRLVKEGRRLSPELLVHEITILLW